MHRIKGTLVSVFCVSLLLLPGGCAIDEPAHAVTTVTFRLATPNAMDGKIAIDEAYLKLSSIETDGTMATTEGGHMTKTIDPADPPMQLTGTPATVDLPIRAGVYAQLALDLVLVKDEYHLLRNGVKEEGPSSPQGGNTGSDNNGEAEEPDSPSQNQGQNQNGNAGTEADDNDDDSGANEPPSANGDENGDSKEDSGTDAQQNDHQKKHDDDHQKGKDKHKKGDKHHGGKHDGRTTELQAASDIDLADFFQNARPGLLVIATYQNDGKSIKLIFVGDGIERLAVPARQNDSPQLILTANGTADITFDPRQWFSSVTPADLDAAIVQQYQGQPVIFIHRDFNSDLYYAVMPHIQESADLNFAGPNF